MRLALLALVAAVGCSTAPVPSQQPAVAVFGRYALMGAGSPTPAVCEVCGGKGTVGDGRVSVPCPACQPQTKTTPSEPKSCLSGTCRPATPATGR